MNVRAGKIGPGDLQFMIVRSLHHPLLELQLTSEQAGRGIMHSEMPIHKPGGKDPFGLQLRVLLFSPPQRSANPNIRNRWIDLPKDKKMVAPSYQELRADQVPSFVLPPLWSRSR